MNATTLFQPETQQDILFRSALERIRMLESEIKKLSVQIERPSSTVRIHQANRILTASINEILFIRAEDNYSRLYLRNGAQYCVSRTLKSWVKELENEDFIRCHRTYFVSRSEVTEINRKTNEIVLKDGVRIPTSRRFQKNGLSQIFSTSAENESHKVTHQPVIHRLPTSHVSPRG